MDFKDNQKKMISLLTDNHKNSVHIDRIIVEQKDKKKFISTDPAKIKLQVEKYYLQAFKKRNFNFQQLSEDWKKQYKPRNYIDPDWYKRLTDKPEDQEINEVLKELSNNKAPEPSGISYEMLKKLNLLGKEILKKIFHLCILTRKIPEKWKLSNIYPIPKKES